MESKKDNVCLRLENVMVRTKSNPDADGLYGFLHVKIKNHDALLGWNQYFQGKRRPKEDVVVTFDKTRPKDSNSELEASFLDVKTGETVPANIIKEEKLEKDDLRYNFTLLVSEIHSIRKITPKLSASHIVIKMANGEVYPPLFFTDGGMKKFFLELGKHSVLSESPNDSNTILVNDFSDPLNRSRSALDVSVGHLVDLNNYKPKESGLVGKFWSTISKTTKVTEKSFDSIDNKIHYKVGTFICLGDKEDIKETISREKLLSKEEWLKSFDESGRILDSEVLKKRIFMGGINPDIRSEVWPFLLSYYPWNSNNQEREQIREKKRKEYLIIKQQWLSISKEQESHFSKYRRRRSDIKKDVKRTDRKEEIYQESNGEGSKKLQDILMTYCFFNWDIGYGQGMSDLLAPILMVMRTEEDSFWCFKGLMDRWADNFSKEQIEMKKHLTRIEKVLYILSSTLHKHLRQNDATNMFFCFRWILVLFKREFSLSQTMNLWETIWSDHIKEFHVFFAVAILMRLEETIISKKMTFDHILKYVAELPKENLDVIDLINYATYLAKEFEDITDQDLRDTIFE